MNCSEISFLLDERDTSRLARQEQAAVQLHLSICPECAREWEAHARLAATPVPSMPAELAVRCRAAFTARAAAAVNGRRSPNRLILLGGVLVAAAAAAMFATRPAAPSRQPAVPALVTTEVEAPAQPPAQLASVAPAAATTVPAAPATPDTPAAKTFQVIAELNNESGDPVVRAAAQVHFDSVLELLRKVPNLRLLGPEEPGSTAEDVRMTFYTSSDAALQSPPAPLQRSPRQGGVIGMRATVKQGDGRRTVMSFSVMGIQGVDCDAATTACSDPARMAASIVELMRMQVFPYDPSFQRELQARVLDPHEDYATRRNALTNALQLLRRNGGAGSVEYTRLVRSAIELAGATDDPAQRVQVLRTLRDVKQPVVVPALGNLLQRESAATVRQEVVTMLAVDHKEDPAARAVLESLAREDSDRMLRMLAQRGLGGEGEWQQYVTANVADASLSDAERLAPFVYLATQAMYGRSSLASQLDDATAAAMHELLVRSWNKAANDSATRGLITLLSMDAHPAAPQLLVDVLYLGREPWIRSAALEALAARREQPGVRALLEAVSAGDGDSELREAVGALLRSGAPFPQPALPPRGGEVVSFPLLRTPPENTPAQ